jgi:hypothetical protein
MKACIKEGAEKIKYACMLMSRHWNAGQACNIANKSDENLAKLNILEPQVQIARS